MAIFISAAGAVFVGELIERGMWTPDVQPAAQDGVTGAPPPDGRYLILGRSQQAGKMGSRDTGEWCLLAWPAGPAVFDLLGGRATEAPGYWWQYAEEMATALQTARTLGRRLRAEDGVTIPRPDLASARGYWDGRIDDRTQQPTVRASSDGTHRVIHVATGTCPSGPCGKRAVRILIRGPAVPVETLLAT